VFICLADLGSGFRIGVSVIHMDGIRLALSSLADARLVKVGSWFPGTRAASMALPHLVFQSINRNRYQKNVAMH